MKQSEYYASKNGGQSATIRRPADAAGANVARAPIGAPPGKSASCQHLNRYGQKCQKPLLKDTGKCLYHG